MIDGAADVLVVATTVVAMAATVAVETISDASATPRTIARSSA